MSRQRVFRQAALDRLASPEQLDQLLQVTSPRRWILLAALLTVLAVLVGWGFLGRVETTADAVGTLVAQNDTALAAVVYVDGLDASLVEAGMTIHLLPQPMQVGEHGFLKGTVEHVSQQPEPGGSRFLVRARLELDPDSASGYRWTSGSGPDLKLRVGTPVHGAIVVDRRRPVELAIPSLGRLLPPADEDG